jgi:putative sterol carrier protein
MAVYTDAEEAKQIFDELWQGILAVESSNQQFAGAGVVLGVYYTDPAYFVAIDGTRSPAVLTDEPDTKVDIEVRMSADTAHTFWKGELNFPVAMMKGKAKIKGPSDKAMTLLPALQPGFELYRQILKEHGREDAL